MNAFGSSYAAARAACLLGVDEDPFVSCDRVTRDLEGQVVGNAVRRSEGSLKHVLAGAGAQSHRRSLTRQGRLGDQVQYAVCRLGAVESRSRTKDHLDPLDVVVHGRNEVEQVHAQGRHARQPVVRQGMERAREEIVEPPEHDVGRLRAAGDDVHPGGCAHVVGGCDDRALRDLDLADDIGGGGRGRVLLLLPGGRYDDRVELEGLRHDHHVERGRGAGSNRHAVLAVVPVSERADDDGVAAGRGRDRELAGLVGERGGGVAAEDLDFGPRGGHPRFRVGDGPGEGSCLAGRRAGAGEEAP